ncbi:tetratricopeptide repeat protein [Undibacterium fentianense]|uniref:Protein kinase domain-containing protein n=1 Tax=Undibacterium fentianense TaxID=2828728 RepID=A0A941E5Q8_9BURK|nr:tetratricopeptide repeat protein [Undibacterium fentianense]MBR7801567.1 hypothetical protein [Undibacterium fentianense]
MPSEVYDLNDNTMMRDLPLSLQHYELRFRMVTDHPHWISYGAWDKHLHRLVVITEIRLNNEETAVFLQRARIAASLSHRAFAKIHALEASDTSTFIVTEYVQGSDLNTWIAQRHNKLLAALMHIRQLAAALLEAQAAGLVDIALQANHLLIDQNQHIRILNLLSSFTSKLPSDRPNNLRALAVIFYRMLTGIIPDDEQHSEHWSWPTAVTPAIRELILSMLSEEEINRISYQDLIEACNQQIDAEGGSGSLSGSELQQLSQQLQAARYKRRRLQVGFTLCGALLVGGVILNAPDDWKWKLQAFIPFSASREFKLGMRALARYDLPPMLDAATQHFNRILERDPNNAAAIAGLSIVYSYRYRSNNPDEFWLGKAKASSQLAQSLNPNLAVSQIALALVLDPRQDFELAIKAARKAKELQPDNLLAWQTEVRVLLLSRQFEKTIQASDLALKKFPFDWLLLNLKGVALLNQVKHAEAEQQFRLSIQHHPDVTLSYGFLATTLDGLNRKEEALQVLQQGLQVRPDAVLYLRLGQTQFARGELAIALSAFEKSIQQNPQSYEVWNSFAEALILDPTRTQEAHAAFQRSLELLSVRLARSPNDSWLVIQAACIEATLGHSARARSSIDHALRTKQTNPQIYLLAARAYAELNEPTLAMENLAIARSLGTTEAQIMEIRQLKHLSLASNANK